jgi:hypothetical protein
MPTNDERADWAQQAVDVFADLTGQVNESNKTNIIDLLADLMHLCNQTADLDFLDLVERAALHFDCEVGEEETENE